MVWDVGDDVHRGVKFATLRSPVIGCGDTLPGEKNAANLMSGSGDVISAKDSILLEDHSGCSRKYRFPRPPFFLLFSFIFSWKCDTIIWGVFLRKEPIFSVAQKTDHCSKSR